MAIFREAAEVSSDGGMKMLLNTLRSIEPSKLNLVTVRLLTKFVLLALAKMCSPVASHLPSQMAKLFAAEAYDQALHSQHVGFELRQAHQMVAQDCCKLCPIFAESSSCDHSSEAGTG